MLASPLKPMKKLNVNARFGTLFEADIDRVHPKRASRWLKIGFSRRARRNVRHRYGPTGVSKIAHHKVSLSRSASCKLNSDLHLKLRFY